MTSLQTIDLSYNELTDLSEPDVFTPPKNLTNLILNHNRMNFLPWDRLVPLENFKHLDLEYNDFTSFDDKLMTILKNGTEIKYAGNFSI